MIAIASRFDPVRSGVAGLATIITGLAAVLYANDAAVNFPAIIVPVLTLGTLAAGALTLLPSRGTWGVNRRTASALVAAIWAVCDIPVWFLALLVATGCACAQAPGYVAPELLGLGTGEWVVMALLAGPLLLLVAASRLPDLIRFGKRYR